MIIAEIGSGVFFDHATGLVIGETAKVGDNCTILHGVTLGGTGKDAGDRHPKVGNDVLIGAGTSILGNIKIGDRSKIGAGSIVLKPIPHSATAVGAPAKVIGWAREYKPGSDVDNALKDIVAAGADGDGIISTRTGSTSSLSTDNNTDSLSKYGENSSNDELKTTSTVEADDHEKLKSEQNERKSKWRTTQPFVTYEENMCIFRMFSNCSKPDTLSYRDICSALEEHCSEDQIGEVYMELLKNDPSKRHVLRCHASETFSSILQKYTCMGKDECEKVRKKLKLTTI